MADIFSYVVTSDTGFAPNPFGGFLTLATCKPKTRRAARVGDWVIGTGSSRRVGAGRLVFAAKVTEVVPLSRYASEPRFAIKQPGQRPAWRRVGDNIYSRSRAGLWSQRANPFHRREDLQHDVGGENALISERFWYFGAAAPILPKPLAHLAQQVIGHRRFRDAAEAGTFEAWIEGNQPGIAGVPFDNVAGVGDLTSACSRRRRVKC